MRRKRITEQQLKLTRQLKLASASAETETQPLRSEMRVGPTTKMEKPRWQNCRRHLSPRIFLAFPHLFHSISISRSFHAYDFNFS